MDGFQSLRKWLQEQVRVTFEQDTMSCAARRCATRMLHVHLDAAAQ